MEEARSDARLSEQAADIQLIHRMNSAIERGDLDGARESLDPGVVWEHNLGEGSPEEGVYRGREDVLGLYRRLLEVWDRIRIEPTEIQELSVHEFEVRGRMHFAHAASPAEITTPYVQRVKVRDGRAAHVRLNLSMGG